MTTRNQAKALFHNRFLIEGLRGLFLVGTLLGVAFFPSAGWASGTLTISGSSMLLPQEKIWAKAYMKAHPGSRIQVLTTGSGVGLSESVRGEVAIGASDFYLTREIQQHHPNLVSIPVAISDAEVIYNLPGFSNKTPVRFDGPVLARIYLGEIRTWDDPALRRLNPDLPLPHRTIHVVHRSDASGTTFVFTDYLSRTSRRWESRIGRGRSPQWTSGKAYQGSAAVVEAVRTTPGAIGYAGLGWVRKSHLPSGALKNRSGAYVVGTEKTIRNSGLAAVSLPRFPDSFNRSIVWEVRGKDVYPDANFEFFLVDTNMDGETMRAVRDWILWVLGPGQESQYMRGTGFVPLPFSPSSSHLSRILHRLIPGNSFRVNSPG
ncbi:MAG: phosphate ABC transporter substrate-binding protein PstS [Leptospirales bacterium]